MSNDVVILLIIGTIIILALGGYAGSLLAKLKIQRQKIAQKQQHQTQAINRHNDDLINSIRLIAKAIAEQQCELSEGAIRICRLLEKVYIEHDADFPALYPSLHQLDRFLADYPTHDGYKALKRQERMRFDVKRAEQELALKEIIERECSSLKTFSL